MTVQTASPVVATPTGRYIVTETLIAIVINIAMAGLVTLLTNRAQAFNGAPFAYAASDIAKATVFPILTFGTGLTFATRKRLGAGTVRPMTIEAAPWAVRNLIVRMLLVSAVALVALGAPTALALYGLGLASVLTPLRLMLFKLTYGAVIGLVVTPVILTLALQDRPRGG